MSATGTDAKTRAVLVDHAEGPRGRLRNRPLRMLFAKIDLRQPQGDLGEDDDDGKAEAAAKKKDDTATAEVAYAKKEKKDEAASADSDSNSSSSSSS